MKKLNKFIKWFSQTPAFTLLSIASTLDWITQLLGSFVLKTVINKAMTPIHNIQEVARVLLLIYLIWLFWNTSKKQKEIQLTLKIQKIWQSLLYEKPYEKGTVGGEKEYFKSLQNELLIKLLENEYSKKTYKETKRFIEEYFKDTIYNPNPEPINPDEIL